MKDAVLGLYRKGYNPRAIARQTGVNYNTVRGWVSKAGLSQKGAGPARGGQPPSRSEPSAAGPAPRKHIVIPDTQCKPGVPLDHLRWAGEYIAEQEPDVVIHLGDHWDMPSLSSYDKGKKDFEGRRYMADVAAGNEGMALLMEGIRKCARRPRLVFLLGNHEERVDRVVQSEPYLEGAVGYHLFDLEAWEVQDYLKPISVDGVAYSHYFYNPMSGNSYGGAIETMLRNIGFTFTMGHQQGLRWGRRELNNGATQIGLVAGSFYQHEEDYKGPQANDHWRGLVVKHEVHRGGYDPMFVSMSYLQRRFS